MNTKPKSAELPRTATLIKNRPGTQPPGAVNPTPGQRTFEERMNAVQVAFVSIEQVKKTPDAAGAIAECFPQWELRYFNGFIDNPQEWRSNLRHYLGQVDAMVLVINDDRKITGSMFRELTSARRLGLTLIIFNLISNRWERYFGYQLYDEQGAEIAPGSQSKLTEIRLKVWRPKTGTANEKNGEKRIQTAQG